MSSASPGSASVVTVLIVDDDPDMRVLVREMFAGTSDLSCEVEEAASGLAGLEAFDRLRDGGHPCVLVLDLQMPDIDGFELAQRVLRRDPHQPMILFTGYSTAVVREHASRVGFDRTVSKTDFHELPAVVASVLRSRTEIANTT